MINYIRLLFPCTMIERLFKFMNEDSGHMDRCPTDVLHCGCSLPVQQHTSSMQCVRDSGREDDAFLHQ